MLGETNYPAPGSSEELRLFSEIQSQLAPVFRRVFPKPREPRTVLVLPSLSLDQDVMSKISGIHYYEERLLCMLMLLRLPNTRVILITSQPVDPIIIDYYLHLLPGVPGIHARSRLTMLSCHDSSSEPLTKKILERPRLMQRIRDAVAHPGTVHMTCFCATGLERTLAVRLGIPIYGCDPALLELGTKSGSRKVLREAEVQTPDGFENLKDAHDIVESLADLKGRHPELERAAVKVNEGFSGEGNAIFPYDGCPAGADLKRWIKAELPSRLCFGAPGESWASYIEKFNEMGGIVESYIESERSPSVQCRIDPLGNPEIISTHEQVLGGPCGQIFLGCAFPAASAYRMDIQDAGLRVAKVLKRSSVIGRFGLDFVSVKEGDRWKNYGVEINLRKGGTTHTFMMLQFLTDGTYDEYTGIYRTPAGQARCYYASDNLQSSTYRGLTPEDLIDIAVNHGLHFHGAAQQGVVFHLIGALSEFGKLGMVSVAETPESARSLFDNTVKILDREAGLQWGERRVAEDGVSPTGSVGGDTN